MNREKLEENAVDSILALMMDDYAQSEGERYRLENERLQADPDAAVPEEVERRALQLIERELAKKNRRNSGKKLLPLLGRLAIAAVVVVSLFGAAYALSPALRAGTLNLLMQIDEQIATWSFTAGADSRAGETGPVEIVVDWLPEGYTKDFPVVIGPSDTVLDCTNDAGGLISVSVHESEYFMHTLDLEDADYYEDILIQNCEGMLRIKDDVIRVVWAYQNTELVVSVSSSDVDADALIQVAENVSILR